MKKETKIDHNILMGFELTYPSLFKNAVEMRPYGLCEIEAIMTDGSVYIYSHLGNTIRQVRKAEDDIHVDLTEDEWRDEFSKRLNRLIQYRNMTQKSLSEKTGISAMSISKYVNGMSLPNPYYIKKIADALHCSVEELVGF